MRKSLDTMNVRTTKPSHEHGEAHLTLPARADLIVCLVAGVIARKQGIDHGDNPYLVEALSDVALAGVEWKWHLRLAEAWWDGWEEMNRIMNVDTDPEVRRPKRRSIVDATVMRRAHRHASPGPSS